MGIPYSATSPQGRNCPSNVCLSAIGLIAFTAAATPAMPGKAMEHALVAARPATDLSAVRRGIFLSVPDDFTSSISPPKLIDPISAMPGKAMEHALVAARPATDLSAVRRGISLSVPDDFTSSISPPKLIDP